jgi:hypothetical protein
MWRASALYLRKGDAPVDDAPVTPAWDSIVPGRASPSSRRRSRYARSTEWDSAPGPRRAWLRELRPLVTGEALTPFIRAALVSDIASPLANSASEGLEYINADAALYLARLPQGEWIGVEYADRVAADGVSVAHCRLYDEHGPIGSSEVCAVLTPRMPRWEEPEP